MTSSNSSALCRSALVACVLGQALLLSIMFYTGYTGWKPSTLFSGSSTSASGGPHGCVVIVHLGDGRPMPGLPQQHSAQLLENVGQLRLFNPDIPIYILVQPNFQLHAAVASGLTTAGATLVTTDGLKTIPGHDKWQQQNSQAQIATNNYFWRYTSERFFYLSALAVQHNLTDIIHIVSDQSWRSRYLTFQPSTKSSTDTAVGRRTTALNASANTNMAGVYGN